MLFLESVLRFRLISIIDDVERWIDGLEQRKSGPSEKNGLNEWTF